MNGAYLIRTYVLDFFTERLQNQIRASPNTVRTYRDTFLLLLRFAQERTGRSADELEVEDIDAELVKCFLCHRKKKRRNSQSSHSQSSHNTRLYAIRSFFRHVADTEPQLEQHCRNVLNIRGKRADGRASAYLTEQESDAILNAAGRSRRLGKRDRTLLLLMLQTGLRISEVVGLRLRDIELDKGAHVRCVTRGGKERTVPLRRECREALQDWLSGRGGNPDDPLFVSMGGTALSHDAVQDLVRQHVASASEVCSSLKDKTVTPHVLRHTAAKQLLLMREHPRLIASWLGYKHPGQLEVDQRTEVASKEGADAQARPLESGHQQSGQKDGLIDILKAL